MAAARRPSPPPRLSPSLSRNDGGGRRPASEGDGDEAPADDVDDDPAAAASATGARGRRTGRGRGAAASATSCGGPAGAAAITLGRLDASDAAGGGGVDPLFHKAARDLDSGGTAGMLLHRLGVRPGGAVAFDSTEAADADADGATDAGWLAAAAAAGGDAVAAGALQVR